MTLVGLLSGVTLSRFWPDDLFAWVIPALKTNGDAAMSQARIDEIDEILRSGVKQFTNDGTTITHDFRELRKERRLLEAALDKKKRPRSFGVDLSGF